MPKYKMIGRDINAPPVNFDANWEAAGVYRTWIVEGEPDFKGEQYTGLKSGDQPLIDVVAYLVPDDAAFDFNLPDPEVWQTTRKTLPESLYDSQLAIVGDYAYLFGGTITDKIFRANINTPVNWEDTGQTLPGPLYGSQLAIIDGYIYLFGGGDDDGYSTDVIYRASTSDPLTWEDTGAVLPDELSYSQLAIIDGYIYLYGGQHEIDARNVIYKASVIDPLTWADTGATLPQSIFGHQLCIFDGYVYLIGGIDFDKNSIDIVYKASLSSPTTFAINSNLPFPTAFGQIVFIGDSVYYFGGYGTGGSVLRAKLFSPGSDPLLTFNDRGILISGTVTHSQVGIINDRIYLFGGNGSSIIWAAGNKLKITVGNNLTYQTAVKYELASRTDYDSTSTLDLFKELGFPPWKTDYGSY